MTEELEINSKLENQNPVIAEYATNETENHEIKKRKREDRRGDFERTPGEFTLVCVIIIRNTGKFEALSKDYGLLSDTEKFLLNIIRTESKSPAQIEALKIIEDSTSTNIKPERRGLPDIFADVDVKNVKDWEPTNIRFLIDKTIQQEAIVYIGQDFLEPGNPFKLVGGYIGLK